MQSNSFTFLTYNVNCAIRDQALTSTRWGARKDRVAALIKESNADIVNLIELRDFEDEQSVASWLYESFGSDYHYYVRRRNSTSSAFSQAILWKKNEVNGMGFICASPAEDQRAYSLMDLEENVAELPYTQGGNMALAVRLVRTFNGAPLSEERPFWIFNVHIPIREEYKMTSCENLVKLIEGLCSKDNAHFVLAGDFNTFFDLEGAKQRDLLRKQFSALSEWSRTSHMKEAVRDLGTFVGFEADTVKRELASPEETSEERAKKLGMPLDYIYGSELLRAEEVVVITKTMNVVDDSDASLELTTRDLPSDHLPLFATISVESK